MNLPDTTANADLPLYAGDTGTLPFDTRKALCKLVNGPFIDADSLHWTALLRDEALLRQHLAEMFLELVLDRDRQVAFTRQANTGELDAPVLLRTSALTFMDSVMVVQLRQLLMEADGLGQRAVVEESALREHLEVYAASAGKDAVLVGKRIGASIEKMKKNSILLGIRGSDDRFEISPALRLLFTPDDVEAVTRRYQQMLAGDTAATAPDEEEADG